MSSNFQLSKQVDPNKIFLIKVSELEGRLDPVFYSSNLGKLISGIYEIQKLEKFTTSIVSGVGAGKQNQTVKNNGILQIRPTNINADGLLKYDKNIFLPPTSMFPRIQVDDILFNNTNSQELVGKTAILKEEKELFFSNHITKITVDRKRIIPDYLAILLNIYQKNKIFYSICTNWNNQSGVGLDLLKSLKIPIPPKEAQAQIVAKMDAAYIAKKQKEAEARRLLDSIDDYLLGELGIELPEQEENTIASRMFERQLSEVSGGRFDPKLYYNRTAVLKLSIASSIYKKSKLKQLIVSSIAGDWGKDLYANTDGYSKCLVIRATEFDNSFNLMLNNSRLKYRLIKNSKLLKINVQENDLLIEKSGGGPDQPVGRIAILTDDVLQQNSIIGYSNFIQKIRVNESQILSNYLFCFLKTTHNIGLTDAMQSQTSGIRNLIMSNYYNQDIPLPPLEKQTEIANHITNIRNQAKKLQQQAITELEQAKKEVEVMILG